MEIECTFERSTAFVHCIYWKGGKIKLLGAMAIFYRAMIAAFGEDQASEMMHDLYTKKSGPDSPDATASIPGKTEEPTFA